MAAIWADVRVDKDFICPTLAIAEVILAAVVFPRPEVWHPRHV